MRMEKGRRFDLEDRLVDYAVWIIKVSEALPKTRAGKHIASQLLRSGTSPASNYGEAQGAESKRDFVHKLKVSLKELRETKVWIKIIRKAGMVEPPKLDPLLQETGELVAILYTSIRTAQNHEKR
jgi:four helix bundle protein